VIAGNLFVISAPSGAGKTSLVREVLQADNRVRLSVSYTTRAPRPGEVEGRDYHFISRERFQQMLDHGDFVESAKVYDNYYGTSQRWLEGAMREGSDIILEIDWQGAAQVRRIFPEASGIFILPPSLETLKQRLIGRRQDSAEIIAHRLAAAREDIRHVGEFDYVIINNDFNVAAQDLLAIFRARRLELSRQSVRHTALIQELT